MIQLAFPQTPTIAACSQQTVGVINLHLIDDYIRQSLTEVFPTVHTPISHVNPQVGACIYAGVAVVLIKKAVDRNVRQPL